MADLIARLKKLSKRLAADFEADLVDGRRDGILPAAVADTRAMYWRMHAEVGLSSFAGADTLRQAADLLDQFAGGFPPGERFKTHIVFAIDGPPEGLGAGTLAFIAWTLQGRFCNARGDLLTATDAAAFEHMARELAQPLPASFFDQIGDETVMDAVVEALYDRQGGRWRRSKPSPGPMRRQAVQHRQNDLQDQGQRRLVEWHAWHHGRHLQLSCGRSWLSACQLSPPICGAGLHCCRLFILSADAEIPGVLEIGRCSANKTVRLQAVDNFAPTSTKMLMSLKFSA